MNREKYKRLSRRDFKRIVENRRIMPLEHDKRMYNLAKGYWVYDELIADIRRAGWVRFGPGFKAGVYGHPHNNYCIKLMGMGVGTKPSKAFSGICELQRGRTIQRTAYPARSSDTYTYQ